MPIICKCIHQLKQLIAYLLLIKSAVHFFATWMCSKLEQICWVISEESLNKFWKHLEVKRNIHLLSAFDKSFSSQANSAVARVPLESIIYLCWLFLIFWKLHRRRRIMVIYINPPWVYAMNEACSGKRDRRPKESISGFRWLCINLELLSFIFNKLFPWLFKGIPQYIDKNVFYVLLLTSLFKLRYFKMVRVIL